MYRSDDDGGSGGRRRRRGGAGGVADTSRDGGVVPAGLHPVPRLAVHDPVADDRGVEAGRAEVDGVEVDVLYRSKKVANGQWKVPPSLEVKSRPPHRLFPMAKKK
jgi:hypothetical protein